MTIDVAAVIQGMLIAVGAALIIGMGTMVRYLVSFLASQKTTNESVAQTLARLEKNDASHARRMTEHTKQLASHNSLLQAVWKKVFGNGGE